MLNGIRMRFQFKHCTIIRKSNINLTRCKKQISIQALYDYKSYYDSAITTSTGFQFKHCTIISSWINYFIQYSNEISIQALYDYKKNRVESGFDVNVFQFKHCTIIRDITLLN